MTFRTVLAHRCYNPRVGQTRPEKCRCRKLVTKVQAMAMVEAGIAEYELIRPLQLICCPDCDGRGTTSLCTVCEGSGRDKKDPLKPCHKCIKGIWLQNSCNYPYCFGTGFTYARGNNIVLVVRAAKTPRVATIDEDHIRYAYVDNQEWAQDRIEEWGELSQEVLRGLVKTYWPTLPDPFKGMPVLTNIGGDQRSSHGKDLTAIPKMCQTEDMEESHGAQ
jgi:hypothetical protein